MVILQRNGRHVKMCPCMTVRGEPIFDNKDNALFADSAYAGSDIADHLPDGCANKICEKGYRDNPLTKKQKASNCRKSKTRYQIEHIFGFMTNSVGGITIRSIRNYSGNE